MKYSAFAALVIVASMVCSCQTTGEYLATFHGKDRSYVLGRLGPPDVKEPDYNGGEIWIYQKKSVYMSPAKIESSYKNKNPNEGHSAQTIKPAVRRVHTLNRSFYINDEGIIYDTAHGSRSTQE